MKIETISIPLGSKKDFINDLSRLNKKAQKIGYPEIKSNFHSQLYNEVKDDVSCPTIKVDLELEEVSNQFSYQPLAKVIYSMVDNQITGLVKLISAKQYSQQLLRIGERPAICQHCNIERFRKEIYVLQHEDGELFTVGSSCIEDFLQGLTLNTLKYWDIIAELNQTVQYSWNNYQSYSNYYPLKDVLTKAVQSIEKNGFHKSIESNSTKKDVLENWNLKVKPTEEITNKVFAILNWIQDMSEAEDNNYLLNIKNIGQANFVDHTLMGIAVSIPVAYDNSTKPSSNSKFLGEKGSHLEGEAILVSHKVCDTPFGISHLYTFDMGGSDVVWFSSKNAKIEPNEIFHLKAKVKSHSVFRDKKQTIINYTKLVKI